MIPINRIFVDMDGVLADFVQGVQGPKYLNGPLTDNLYDDNKIALSNKGLFKDLPPMIDMQDLIDGIKDTGIYWEILTCTGELNRKKQHKTKPPGSENMQIQESLLLVLLKVSKKQPMLNLVLYLLTTGLET